MARSSSKDANATSSQEDFAQFLLDKSLVAKERLDSLSLESKRTGRRLPDLVVESGALSEQETYNSYAEFLGVNFKALTPETTVVSAELFKLIPQEAAERYGFVPLGREGVYLDVGMLRPEDVASQDALHFIMAREGLKQRTYLITPSAFRHILRNYESFKTEVSSTLQELEKTFSEQEVPKTVEKQVEVAGEAPIIKMAAVILRQAVEGGASDIHIEPGRTQLRVRFRVDGVLYTSIFLPMQVHGAIISRFKILAVLKIDETRLAQDGRFHANISGKEIDFRVATLPTSFGEKISIRVLDPTSGIIDMPHLGLAGQSLKALEETAKKPFGIVLITGPTGSGKSTTLYAVLKKITSDSVNIVTLEDPVEYFIEGVNQSQINDDIGYGFASGLRHILRGDPNIIMVGEVRDKETAELVIHAGLTGHLVFSTLHTNNAIGAIPRLIDLGIDAFLLPPSLSLIVAQRLVQMLCPYCKKPRKPTAEEKGIIEKELAGMISEAKEGLPKEIQVWEAPGCLRCGKRGTKGRTAVFEVFQMTKELAAIISPSVSEAKLEEEARRQKMITMFQDGLRKVLAGQIAFAELMRVVEEQRGEAII